MWDVELGPREERMLVGEEVLGKGGFVGVGEGSKGGVL